MVHPGLPYVWGGVVGFVMLLASLWMLRTSVKNSKNSPRFNLISLPVLGNLIRYITTRAWVLTSIKSISVILFLMVIVAGLFGTPIAERNLATMLTWNVWWAGLILAVFFLGTTWCSICPWDAIATWLVRRRLWLRAEPNNSFNLRVPKQLRTIWPALLLFTGLTWLELGAGVTTNPYATALLALIMVVLATLSLSLFERKAFCQYFCPIGRTVGFYAQLAPVELRPIDNDVCLNCTSLECFHGTDLIEPCPTHLVMGTLKQSTYCTSCGNCSQSCPEQNVAWRLRSPSTEAIQESRPHWDEAWFMLGLMALTLFHGVTMMPFWSSWISNFGQIINDSGQMLWTFSIGLIISLLMPIFLYAMMVWLTKYLTRTTLSFRRVFTQMAFVAIPLAFAYHLAHNLNHLLRESIGTWAVLQNPLGNNMLPLSLSEQYFRHMQLQPHQDILFAVQAGLMVFGFIIAIKVIHARGQYLFNSSVKFSAWKLMPVLLFAVGMTSLHLFLLMQPMTMRM
ncbi:MAG: 4Fe-4S binding protein [Methylococcales bacterium]|nr:4Fe-4S binding protein [Methylococcales bacterium]MBT7410636.1 4Fe-4S binding protein [Methylococcales bacterium]